MTTNKPARLTEPVRNEAAERLVDREMIVRFAMAGGASADYSEDEFRSDLDAALAAERRATVREIRGRLFEAAWRSDGHEWLDPKVVSAILDEEAAR